MSDPALFFLPWVDRGGTAARPADQPGTHPANRISTSAEVFVNDTGPASVSVQVMGPGDVNALAPQQVIRSDPAPGTRSFESNYLALVEFDEPALPWLFTPASAVAGRLRPWLCLVVVQVGPGVRIDPPGTGPLPVLRIGPPARPEVELPDLADSWAWAHAQVAPDGRLGAHRGPRWRPRAQPVTPHVRPAARPADRLRRLRRADVRGRSTIRAGRRPS